MIADQPLTDFEVASGPLRGSRLTLYANRLVQQGADSMETVPLAQLASVRVAFERDTGKLHWAIGLLVVALILASVSGPLQSWMSSLAAGVKDHAGRESLDGFLVASFSVLGGIARLLLPLAIVLAALAAALLAFFWIGLTTLTLSFAATERAIPVRGRNHFLIQFAEAVAAQLAVLPGKRGP